MIALLNCLWGPNIYIIAPRFISVALRCCKPLVISRVITFIHRDLPPFENRNEAFRLIVFTFIIYAGMAVCYMPITCFCGRIFANSDRLVVQWDLRALNLPTQLPNPHGISWYHL